MLLVIFSMENSESPRGPLQCELCQPGPVLFHPDRIYFLSALLLTVGSVGSHPDPAIEAAFPALLPARQLWDPSGR